MAEVVDRDPGEEVEVTFAIDVEQPAAVAAIGDQRVAAVGGGNVGQSPLDPGF